MCQKLYCSLSDPNSNVGLKSLSICRAGDKNKQAIENGDSDQFPENGTMMPKRLAPIVHLANSKKKCLGRSPCNVCFGFTSHHQSFQNPTVRLQWIRIVQTWVSGNISCRTKVKLLIPKVPHPRPGRPLAFCSDPKRIAGKPSMPII